jgi:hypothetical protein
MDLRIDLWMDLPMDGFVKDGFADGFMTDGFADGWIYDGRIYIHRQ